MYRKADPSELTPENFELPIGTKLSGENRWVIMTSLIPWEKFEQEYAKNFSEEMGAPADIKYPTDWDLLNQARKATEAIIDILYFTLRGKFLKKPRTYRIIARKEYLKIAKKRRPSHQ